MKSIVVEAPAKINLFLQVGPVRQDGYHPVRTVMQCLAWCDLLELGLVPGEGSLVVEPRESQEQLGGAGQNLAWRAWELLAREAGPAGRGLNMRLTKRIPLSAGLGGGSADAAAVLLGANHLLDDPLGPQRLASLAAELGSDVPFFLAGGTALAEGRGELVTPLMPAPAMHVVVANPGVPLSTASVYRRFDALGGGDFAREELDKILSAMRSGQPAGLVSALRNDLEESCLALLPQAARLLDETRAALSRLGITGSEGAVMISGSGPTVCALLREERAARELAETLSRHAPVVYRTRFRSHGCRILQGGIRKAKDT